MTFLSSNGKFHHAKKQSLMRKVVIIYHENQLFSSLVDKSSGLDFRFAPLQSEGKGETNSEL